MTRLPPWLQATALQSSAQFREGRLPHALILLGQRGLGKAAFADWLARLVLCRAPEPEGACGTCKSCLLLAADSHPDYYPVAVPADKTMISVEQIRSLISELQESAHQSGWRVASISDLHAMNTNAFNALLKTLEEPGSNTLILMQATQLSRIPATIRSRCQLLKFSPPPLETARDWLQQETGADPESLARLLTATEGAPLAAADWLAAGKDQQLAEFETQLQALEAGAVSPLALAADWKEQTEDVVHWLSLQVSRTIRRQMTEGHEEAGAVPLPRLFALSEQLLEARRLLQRRANANPQSLLESLLIPWPSKIVKSAGNRQ